MQNKSSEDNSWTKSGQFFFKHRNNYSHWEITKEYKGIKKTSSKKPHKRKDFQLGKIMAREGQCFS